jgi:hypothetical protein
VAQAVRAESDPVVPRSSAECQAVDALPGRRSMERVGLEIAADDRAVARCDLGAKKSIYRAPRSQPSGSGGNGHRGAPVEV